MTTESSAQATSYDMFYFTVLFSGCNPNSNSYLSTPASCAVLERYHWKFHRPTDPPANLVGDAFGKRRPVGRCGGGSVTAGTTGCGWI